MDIQKARSFYEEKGKVAVYCYSVKYKIGWSKKDVVLALTESGASIFYKNEVNFYASWIYIKSLSIDGNKIKMHFAQAPKFNEDLKLKFESKESSFIMGAIGDILQHVLQKFELKQLNIKQFHFQKSRPTTLSIISRFFERANTSKVQVSEMQKQQLFRILQLQLPVFDFSAFESFENIFYFLIDIVPMIDSISDVFVPPMQIQSVDALNAMIRRPNSIENIFLNTINEDVGKFIVGCQEAEDTPLSSLGFYNCALNADHLNKIAEANKDRQFRHLSFQNTIKNDAIPIFHNILQRNLCDSLVSLNLDNTPDLDLKSILPNIEYIQILSLQNCGLEISKALELLQNQRMENLKFLNLSQNKCDGDVLSNKLKLPNKLTVIALDFVHFINKSLSKLMKILFDNLPDNFSLQMSSIQVDNNKEFERMFALFGKLDGRRLSELVWNNNPIDERLFLLLEKCPNIVSLSLGGCFSDGDKKSIVSFSKCIKKFSNMRKLRINGSQQKKIGQKSLNSLVKNFSKLSMLEIFDISNNSLGDEGISQVFTTLQQLPKLDIVCFDGNEISSPNTLLNISRSMSNKRLSFPEIDVSSLFAQNKIDNNQYEELKKQWRIMLQKNGTLTSLPLQSEEGKSKYPKPQKNGLDIATTIYYHVFEPYFPQKLTEERAQKIINSPPPQRTPYKSADDSDDSDTGSDDTESSDDYSDEDSDESSEENVTTNKKNKDKNKKKPKKRRNQSDSDDDSDDDDDEFVSMKSKSKNSKYSLKSSWQSPNRQIMKKNKKQVKVFEDDSDESDDESDDDIRGMPKSVLHKQAPKTPKSKNSGLFYDKKKRGLDSDSDDNYNRRRKNRGSPYGFYDSSDDDGIFPVSKSRNSSDDDDMDPLPNMGRKGRKVKQMRAPEMKGTFDESSSSDYNEEEDMGDFEPQDPDWSFPLRYVPRPPDTEQIIRDFGEKYSLSSLLTVVKRS